MNFGIDYHGTYSRDPEGFAALVKLLQSRGHKCFLVTGIADENDFYSKEVRVAIGDTMPIIFTAGAWKRRFVEALEIRIDVWIEDTPEGIDVLSEGARASRDQWTSKALEAMRKST